MSKVWVMRDPEGEIMCVGSSSSGVPPQINTADIFEHDDPVILDHASKVKAEREALGIN